MPPPMKNLAPSHIDPPLSCRDFAEQVDTQVRELLDISNTARKRLVASDKGRKRTTWHFLKNIADVSRALIFRVVDEFNR